MNKVSVDPAFVVLAPVIFLVVALGLQRARCGCSGGKSVSLLLMILVGIMMIVIGSVLLDAGSSDNTWGTVSLVVGLVLFVLGVGVMIYNKRVGNEYSAL